MAKRLAATVGEYTNQQNETKGEYVRLGVLMAGNDNVSICCSIQP